MSLNHFLNPNAENKFCKLKNLRNESDVEQNFMVPLLIELGYSEDYIETKKTISEQSIGKRRKRRSYKPDYVCYSDKRHLKPVLIIDAKGPNEDAEDGVSDAQLYASVIRRKLVSPKPEQYCIGTNGSRLVIKHYDRDATQYDLRFQDLIDGNSKFEAFKRDMNRESRAKSLALELEPFEFKKPKLQEIKGIFETCHNIIWRKEVTNPQSAFYEFCKLMFIKLNEDKKLRSDQEIRKLIENGKPLPRSKVFFSAHWIEENEETEPNPINTTLFRQVRDSIELEILRGKKKRMFESKEEIDLRPSTIKEVVGLLEHHDLFGIDEDLNGRLFETFLGATMRGKELGQFFTPRSVVKFMVELADLQVTEHHVDLVLDACCGTAGFLIEAMAQMIEKVNGPSLSRTMTPNQREILIRQIKDRQMLGIDLGKQPPVARIARINMYLHGDGGSRIYYADGLDKQTRIGEEKNPELIKEREELRTLLSNMKGKIDIVLTNPPFAMRYKRKDPVQGPILEEYYLANHPKRRSSLKSNVMFLERHGDLVKPNGKLITIIDESTLNTRSNKTIRDWLRRNFIIRAVISLPRNTFVKAGSVMKTSVIYLIRKVKEDDPQPEIFMAISENVGHNDTGRETPETSDLETILNTFGDYLQGKFSGIKKKPNCFIVEELDRENPTRRLDAHFFDPNYPRTMEKLIHLSKREGWNLLPLNKLLRDSKTNLSGGATPKGAKYVDEGVPFIRIQNVRKNRLYMEKVKFIIRAFHEGELKRSQLKPRDVLLTITGSYGMSAVVPSNLREANINQHIVKIEVDKKIITPFYLSCFLNIELCKRQMDRAVTGGTRPALDYDAIRALMILFPSDQEIQNNIAERVHETHKKADKILEEAEKRKQEYEKVLSSIDSIFIEQISA